MSSVALGASRVGAVISTLAKHGYRCGRLSASGQRRGRRVDEDLIAGDIIALAPESPGLPHLLVEVGGVSKRLAVAFTELRASLWPGAAALIVRFVDRRRLYYVDEDSRHEDLESALEALRLA